VYREKDEVSSKRQKSKKGERERVAGLNRYGEGLKKKERTTFSTP